MEERDNQSNNPDPSVVSEELTMSGLDQQLERCRRLNTRLDAAADVAANSAHKSTRLHLFIKSLLTNCQLMRIYATLTSNLTASATKFACELKQVEDDDYDKNFAKTQPIEYEKMAKMVQTNVELARLIVELTSPLEMLAVNRTVIYPVLTRFEVKGTTSDSTDDDDEDDDRRILDNKDYAVYLLKYKELFVKLELFAVLSENLLASIRLVNALVELDVGHTSARRRALIEPRLKSLFAHLLDSVLMNLCMARNLLIEKNETFLNALILRLLENKFDQALCESASLGRLLRPDAAANLLYSLLAQVNSLVFSTFGKLASSSTTQSSSKSSSYQLRQALNKYAVCLCKSGSFGHIVTHTVQHLTASKRAHLDHHTDISYFLWLIKFIVANFVLKRLEPAPLPPPPPPPPLPSTEATTSVVSPLEPSSSSSLTDEKLKSEKTFFNDTTSSAAVATKRALLSYDLLAFLVFTMLGSFERLLFESNAQNMAVLRMFNAAQKTATATSAPRNERQKLVNTRMLNLFYLSISCVYEVIECINLHLEYLESSQYQKEKKEDFLLYLNEFINFDELKQSFAMFMRFYAYNPHVYSDSLVKILIICNQNFLNTYRNVQDMVLLVQQRERDRLAVNHYQQAGTSDTYELVSDTNATKNSSTVSSFAPTTEATLSLRGGMKKIYDLYANTDTSFVLKKVLVNFEHNDPLLNRSCIDFLDALMIECRKHEKLFHMNLALSLANITLLESFRSLDQRIKDLISAILVEIRCMCKRKPRLANKILFDVQKASAGDTDLKRKLMDEISTKESKRMRRDYTTTDSDQSMLLISRSRRMRRSRQDTSSGDSSTCSSLVSSTSESMSPQGSQISSPPATAADTERGKRHEHEVKLLVENEFLFCLRSLDAFNKSKCLTKRLDSKKIGNFIVKNDHLYRILKYLIQLFESVQSPLGGRASEEKHRVTSWTIYSCLLSMKFDVNDKIKFINQLNSAGETARSASSGHPMTSNLSISPGRNEFYMSNQCMNLRVACSTEEFRHQLKDAYIKYLVETLCIKSKKTRNAIFWLFSFLKKVKLFHVKKSFFTSNSSSRSMFENLMSTPGSAESTLFSNSGSNRGASASSSSNFLLTPSSKSSTSSASIFEFKLFYYYYINSMNIPLIPFSYDIQQVFHSVNFANLLDLIGIVRTDKGFPFIPKEWLSKSRKDLNECLNCLEKCLCI